MQVLNGDGGSSRVIKAIHSLDTENKHNGNVEHQRENKYREDAHPGGQPEIAVAVVGTRKHRVTIMAAHVELAKGLYLCSAQSVCAYDSGYRLPVYIVRQ